MIALSESRDALPMRSMITPENKQSEKAGEMIKPRRHYDGSLATRCRFQLRSCRDEMN